MYWWTGIAGLRILLRCEMVAEEYARLRVLTATPEEVLRIGYGVGESFNLALVNIPLEKAS
jgi:hypothetical protein